MVTGTYRWTGSRWVSTTTGRDIRETTQVTSSGGLVLKEQEAQAVSTAQAQQPTQPTQPQVQQPTPTVETRSTEGTEVAGSVYQTTGGKFRGEVRYRTPTAEYLDVIEPTGVRRISRPRVTTPSEDIRTVESAGLLTRANIGASQTLSRVGITPERTQQFIDYSARQYGQRGLGFIGPVVGAPAQREQFYRSTVGAVVTDVRTQPITYGALYTGGLALTPALAGVGAAGRVTGATQLLTRATTYLPPSVVRYGGVAARAAPAGCPTPPVR